MPDYTPGQAADATGLTHDTLRYYEREGLIGPVTRTAAGRRSYSDDDVTWIGVVTCMRDAGLGIDDLRRFTALLRDGADTDDRVTFLEERRRVLERRADAIAAALRVLDDKIAHSLDKPDPSIHGPGHTGPGPAHG